MTSPAAPAPVQGGADDDPPDEAELGYDPDYLPTVVYGEAPRPPRLAGHDPHESPWTMALPVAVLGALSVVGGLLNIPLKGVTYLESWLAPVFRGVHQPVPTTFGKAGAVTGIAFVAGALGILLAFLAYRRGLRTPADDPLRDRLGPAADLVGHGYYYDDGISAAVDGPVRAGADFLDEDVDQAVIDGAVNGTGRLVRRIADELGRAQDGFVRRYAVGIALGAAAILLYLIAFVGR